MRPYLRVSTAILVCIAFLVCVSTTIGQTCDDPQSSCLRPIPLGVSGGNINDISKAYCCGGTLGALVQDANGFYILSNNHVLARTNKGESGDDIIHPGLIDQVPVCSQDASDRVADLTRFVPISFKRGTNLVDAAIAEIVPGKVDASGTILGINTVSPHILAPEIGLSVTKSGRTTGQTFGMIVAVDVTADVAYDRQCGMGTQIARFINQIRIEPGAFSSGGDSGAVIVENLGDEPQPVGLLFAGSSTTTLANPMGAVLESLCVAMAGSSDSPDPSACASGGDGGGGKGGGPPPGKGPKSKNIPAGLKVASAVKARHEGRIFEIPSAVGTGLSFDKAGQPVIEVYVKKATRKVVRRVPKKLEGISVRVVETGAFRAH